jgi:cell division protein FtsA
VRLGFPVGITGIVQLVQGPQYATGVGLVRHGAQRLLEAALRGDETAPERGADEPALSPAQRNGFWGWFKNAF